MRVNNFLGLVLRHASKQDLRQLVQWLQPTVLESRFFKKLPLGEEGASEGAVSPSHSPASTPHSSKTDSLSTGDQECASSSRDFPLQRLGAGAEPTPSNTAPKEDQTDTLTSRYVSTFKTYSPHLPYSGASKILPPELGANYSGPLGPPSGQGLPDRVFGNSCAGYPTQLNGFECTKSNTHRERDPEISGQRGYSLGTIAQNPDRFSEYTVSCTKERWGAAPCSKFETFKSVAPLRAFQDGGDT